jgi:hypothetical protein
MEEDVGAARTCGDAQRHAARRDLPERPPTGLAPPPPPSRSGKARLLRRLVGPVHHAPVKSTTRQSPVPPAFPP